MEQLIHHSLVCLKWILEVMNFFAVLTVFGFYKMVDIICFEVLFSSTYIPSSYRHRTGARAGPFFMTT